MNYLSDMLGKLTDNLNKNTDSNIGKLFSVVAPEMEELYTVFNNILLWQDIDTAEGTTLDRIGKNLGQLRGGFTDVQYRLLLKAKVKQSISKGDIDTIIETIACLINTDVKNIKVDEIFPASLHIEFPYSVLTEELYNNLDLLKSFIKSIFAGGVGLTETYLLGTFELGTADNIEYDETAGFSNVSQTVGGYFGGIF